MSNSFMRISTVDVAAAHAFYADIILQGLAGLFPGHRPHRTFYPRSHLRVVAAFVNLQQGCTTLPYNFRLFLLFHPCVASSDLCLNP